MDLTDRGLRMRTVFLKIKCKHVLVLATVFIFCAFVIQALISLQRKHMKFESHSKEYHQDERQSSREEENKGVNNHKGTKATFDKLQSEQKFKERERNNTQSTPANNKKLEGLDKSKSKSNKVNLIDRELSAEVKQNTWILNQLKPGIHFLQQMLEGNSSFFPTNTFISIDTKDCLGTAPKVDFNFHQLTTGIYLFSAFWDARPTGFEPRGPYIRIIGISNRNISNHTLRCVFNFNDRTYISATTVYHLDDTDDKTLRGHVYSCQVPRAINTILCSMKLLYSGGNTTSVSEKSIVMPVLDTRFDIRQYKFAQCVPPLFGNIQEKKLWEFMELSRLLGSEHVTFYYAEHLSKPVQQLLRYYQLKGVATVIPWHIPNAVSRNGSSHGHIAASLDCLYRNMKGARYLAFQDLDEVIIPHKHSNWHDMIAAMDQERFAGFLFKSAYFDRSQEVPQKYVNKNPQYKDHSTVLHTVMRTRYINRHRTKYIVKPYHVSDVGIYSIIKTTISSSKVHLVDPKRALVHHYAKCSSKNQNCQTFIVDDSALRFSQRLKSKVKFAIEWLSRFFVP